MRSIDNPHVAEATNEPDSEKNNVDLTKNRTEFNDTSFLFEQDRTFRRIYPVHAAYVPVEKATIVDLAALELLASEYNTPHFVITDYVRTDSSGIEHDVKGWALHFMHLANSGLIVAYEKKENSTGEPCAAVLAKKEAEDKV